MNHIVDSRAALERAVEMDALVRIADRFVKGMTPKAWGNVPLPYRPSAIRSRDDLAHWVVRLENCIPAHAAPEIREFLRDAMARADEIGPRRNCPPGRRYGLGAAVMARRGGSTVNPQHDNVTSPTDSCPSDAALSAIDRPVPAPVNRSDPP